MSKRDAILNFIQENDGVLRLRPAWVAHDFLAGGHRLNLKEEEYDCGERGEIMERWFCSETHAVNTIDIPTEGISFLEIPGEDITIPEALKECRMEILGEEYGKTHDCLGRLADADQVEHFRARRTVRHAHIVEQRVLLAEQAEYLFALADVNDRYGERKAALRGHLRCMLHHIKYPPPAR